ncbi:MAG: serine hydrolase [Kofleriaceae bacterium]
MRAAASVTALVAFGLLVSPVQADKPAELPEIRAKSAVVLDADTGAEIFSKDADSVRAIASTTKIFVAMAVRKKQIDLDGYTEITRADAEAAKGGSRTRLDIGQSFKNIDLLRAMLISSDNRAPTALGRAAGMSRAQLIAAMNRLARDLGLKRTTFTDSSGLRGNVSTAREMALALQTAHKDPVLAEIMGTTYYVVQSRSGANKIAYGSTNQPMVVGTYKVTGGKTGFTKAAGYCYITAAEFKGHSYLLAFYGGDTKASRFTDFAKVAAWLDAGAPGAKVKPTVRARAKHSSARRRVSGAAR